jgi:multiple sugar transport system substrate-binding protein
MKQRKVTVFTLSCLLLLSFVSAGYAGGKKESVQPETTTIPEGDVIVTEGLPYPVPQYPIEQEREAILAAREIMRGMPGGVTLNVLISPDNVADYEPFYPEWERETGMKIVTHTVPWPDWFKELMNVSITKTDKYDVFMSCPQWTPDLAEAKVIENIDPFVEKYTPQIADPASPHRILPGLESYMKYRGDYYFFFSDTDVATLYYRKDWVADPDNKRRFQNTYGYALKPPETVEEWRDQLEFFTKPDEGIYGMAMSWGDEVAFDFYPRFLSQKAPFFDDQMHPNVNSPAAIKALEEMKDLLPYAMPGTLEFDAARALEAFAGGNIYCTLIMTWAQGYFENPEASKVVGKVGYAPYPGRRIGGELVRPQPQYWGWGYSVSAYSKHKELAYLYSQWMSGAAMNARVALTPGGWYDVCKLSNYDESMFPEIRRKNGGIYMDKWMENQKWQVAHCFPPIAMRGGAEYSGVLLEAVSGVLKGAQEPQAAMDEVAARWEEITDRYGREGQIRSWNSLKAMYAPAVQEWLGFR